MDFKQIKDLINLINDSNIGEIQIKDKEFKIRIRHQHYQQKAGNSSVYMPSMSAGTAAPSTPEASPPPPTPAEKEEAEKAAVEAENADLITVKSPMIGTFYRASGPDKPPYVKVGDHVNKEDVLCVIEAMKLFNEIECEVTGRIVKVLVENESPVEYDQPLFLIDPNG